MLTRVGATGSKKLIVRTDSVLRQAGALEGCDVSKTEENIRLCQVRTRVTSTQTVQQNRSVLFLRLKQSALK